MQRTLGEEPENRGRAIATGLAASSTDRLLTGDAVGLNELVNRTRFNNPDVRYILVVDRDGNFRANPFGDGAPRGLLEANLPGIDMQPSLRRIDTDEGLVLDTAAGLANSPSTTAPIRVCRSASWRHRGC